MKQYLMTSRFTNETWRENQSFVAKTDKLGCIYCAPDQISKQIPIDAILFILEMNNETNKIMGIGMTRNHPMCNRYYVYENGNYNRFTFPGKYRIDRSNMDEMEEKIMKVFDQLCFKGNKHMKRGQGLKSFPVEMLYRCSKKLDLVNFISEMFKKRISSKNIEE